jgi:hypothetical protein
MSGKMRMCPGKYPENEEISEKMRTSGKMRTCPEK